MENKKLVTFTFSIVAIILGVVLFKKFNFETLKFEHTGLGVIYLVTFVFAIYILIKSNKNRTEK
jgi:predicted ferric reductase